MAKSIVDANHALNPQYGSQGRKAEDSSPPRSGISAAAVICCLATLALETTNAALSRDAATLATARPRGYPWDSVK
jgi:hypothetical protein